MKTETLLVVLMLISPMLALCCVEYFEYQERMECIKAGGSPGPLHACVRQK